MDSAAEISLSTAEQLAPDAPNVRLRRIKRAIAQGDFSFARLAIAALPDTGPREQGRRLALSGELAEATWDFEAAATAYRAAIAYQPRAAALHESLGRCVLLSADPRQARAHFAEARQLDRVAILLRGASLNPSQSRNGALLNDTWCDADALTATQQALSASNLELQLNTVNQFPGYTFASISLLITLRRSNRADQADSQLRTPAARRIPRLIHQYWDSRVIPDDVAELTRSWSEHNPAWIYRRFDRSEAQEYLRSNFGPSAARAFRRTRHAAQQADLFRLAVLLVEGGVYADADDRCLASLDAPTSSASLLLRQEHLGSIANNFIAAEPGNSIIAGAFELAVESIARGDSDSIWLSTGPGLMSRATAHYLACEPSRLQHLGNEVQIMTTWQMRPYLAHWCHASYKASSKNWLNQEFNTRPLAAGITPQHMLPLTLRPGS
ncbi:glycosyltransferase family 32 protein [Chelatococcus reniformis]|uniref:glycosyltransferase family 32 protein n=1 Tax=Chelatococcus reniformis TaxID=1494448 RepID=UPI001FCF1BED|nr:glycosyltransferase [Chelatococcus reniformis]